MHRAQTTRRAAVVGALALGLALSTGVSAPAAPHQRQRWIVRYGAGMTAAAADSVPARLGSLPGATVQRFHHVFPGAVMELTPGQAARLRQLPGVASVRPDHLVHADVVQDNPPTGLDRVDQRSASPSHTYSSYYTGRGVAIYTIDSGLNLAHTDFTGRVRRGPDYADTPTGGDGMAKPPSDCHGHGTHVAGIAAGSSKGVAKQALLVPVKVLDCDGAGYASDTVAALDWVVRDHVAGRPAVVNMSLTGPRDADIDAAVNAVLADGVQVVTAAGNIDPQHPAPTHDACTLSPSNVPAALTVANSTATDRQAATSYSGRCVDLFAPGSDIVSDFIGGPTATATMTGTSMAAPAVTGAIALLLQARPSWTPAQVRANILGKATRNVLGGLDRGTPNLLLYTLGAPTPGIVEHVGRPTVQGTAAAGRRLTAAPGTWGVGRISLGYRWYRVDRRGVKRRITVANHASYTPTVRDRGYRLQVRVQGSAPDHVARVAWSAPTGAVA